jgi:RNA polymerase sigma factor (sigma-70 family)
VGVSSSGQRYVLSSVRDRAMGSSGSSPCPSLGPSDEVLLAGMGLGDRAASAAFVQRFQARVYGLALSIVRDPVLAEDLAQEALTRAWRNAGAYDPRRGAVATWLLTITRNLAIDALRLSRAQPIDPDTLADLGVVSDDPEPADAAVLSETARAVRSAIRRLPLDQRRALVLSAFYGRTAQEIASGEGIPLGTAKTRIRSGMLKLRVLLAEATVRP